MGEERSRTCRWAGDAEGIKISVEHQRKRFEKIPPPSVSPSFRRVRLRKRHTVTFAPLRMTRTVTGRPRLSATMVFYKGSAREEQAPPLRVCNNGAVRAVSACWCGSSLTLVGTGALDAPYRFVICRPLNNTKKGLFQVPFLFIQNHFTVTVIGREVTPCSNAVS